MKDKYDEQADKFIPRGLVDAQLMMVMRHEYALALRKAAADAREACKAECAGIAAHELSFPKQPDDQYDAGYRRCAARIQANIEKLP
jgi:hypothetical protein